MNPIAKIENLLLHLKEYVTMRIQLTELKLSSKSSLVASSLIMIMVLSIVFFFFMLVLTFGVALWIGSYFDQPYWGFLIMAGFYLATGLLLYVFRNKWIKQPVNDLIAKELFDED